MQRYIRFFKSPLICFLLTVAIAVVEVNSLKNVNSGNIWYVNRLPASGREKHKEEQPIDISMLSDSNLSIEDDNGVFEDEGRIFRRDVHKCEREATNKDAHSTENTKEIGKNYTFNNYTKSSTETPGNASVTASPSLNSTISSAPPTDEEPDLPEKGAAEEEHDSSMSIFFVLCVLALCILLVHLMLKANFQYLPESVVIVFLGALIGMIINLMSDRNIANWKREEAFSPTAFFLVLLPPIIFESGYNLHKGNFFQNIGSILVFAVFGTVISALVIGGGVYLLGIAEVAYRLSFVESFAFGSLVSAVDPVATVAIFQALDVDPVLNMLVFGESILNDAVAIVLTTTVLQYNDPQSAVMTPWETISSGVGLFCKTFFASAAIGVAFALASALLLKHADLRRHPSLEFALMLVFTYAPYVLAEGLHLSGIMGILSCGIVMSHYTHYNVSPMTQVTMQQTMRTLAFAAESCVFAYLGLATSWGGHRVEVALIVWSLLLCLIGRAANIFPLAAIVNRFREHHITPRMAFIMWFSGLRGAIAYALSLHLEFADETRRVIVTTTLVIVLSTTLILGGSTMPLMKFLQAGKRESRRRRRSQDREISLSKTRKMGRAIDSEHLSELTEEELEVSFSRSGGPSGFAKWDLKYFMPFFTRRFTQQELRDCHSQMRDLTDRWYQAVRASPLDSEDDAEDASRPVIPPSSSRRGRGRGGKSRSAETGTSEFSALPEQTRRH